MNAMKHGLTTWIVSLGRVAVIWRRNMRCAEALHTATVRRYPAYCYVTAGPLIVEWRRQRAAMAVIDARSSRSTAGR